MKYWHKKAKQWWDDQNVVEQDGKIYQVTRKDADGEWYGIDITKYIEVKT